MSASNDGVPSGRSPVEASAWGDAPRDLGASAQLGRGGPNREPAISLMSDRSLRGMIEIWFEVENDEIQSRPGARLRGQIEKVRATDPRRNHAARKRSRAQPERRVRSGRTLAGGCLAWQGGNSLGSC
jgi:hypothetical protein